MIVPPPPVAETAVLDERAFGRVAALADRIAGLAIPSTKRSMVQSRLNRRLRATGLPSFAAYLDLVEGPEGSHERPRMIEALTTNVSHFFREAHHFETLRDAILLDPRAKPARLRIWSAGCSSSRESGQ